MKALDIFTKFESLQLSREELQASITVARLLGPHVNPDRVLEAVAFLLSEPVVSTRGRGSHPTGALSKLGSPRPARSNGEAKTKRTAYGTKRPLEDWRYDKSQGRPGYVWHASHTMVSALPRIRGKEVRVPGMWMPSRAGKKLGIGNRKPREKYADPKILGPAIRQSIADRGLTVDVLATKLGTTKGPIYDWMNGKKLPRRATFDRLARELDLQLEVRP